LKVLLRTIAVLAALHIGVAVLAATNLSLRPEYSQLTRIAAGFSLIVIAGAAGYALWLIWHLRWGGALAMGVAYTGLLGSQLVHLATDDHDFSLIATLVFGTMAAVLLSPQGKRACRQHHQSTASIGLPPALGCRSLPRKTD
jgi:hypothetical protein